MQTIQAPTAHPADTSAQGRSAPVRPLHEDVLQNAAQAVVSAAAPEAGVADVPGSTAASSTHRQRSSFPGFGTAAAAYQQAVGATGRYVSQRPATSILMAAAAGALLAAACAGWLSRRSR